jgi:hypothetical protein
MQTIEKPALTSSRGPAFILPHRIITHFDAMGAMDKSVEEGAASQLGTAETTSLTWSVRSRREPGPRRSGSDRSCRDVAHLATWVLTIFAV